MGLSFGLGLPPAPKKGVRLFPQASAGWDFVRGAYKNASGYVRTNTVTNPLMTGGVAGVLGSGGSLPTGWSYSTTITGLTYTVSYGSVGGRPYIDFRASGTAGGSSYLNLNFASAPPSASNGQTWTNAADIALQAGSLTNISQSVMQINENTSGGAYVSGGSTGNLALTSTPARFWYTRTLSGGGTVGKALPIFTFNVAAAGAVDVTYRIFAPQMEQTAYPTSFLVGATTTFTSTNPADVGNMTFTRASTGYAEDAQGKLVLFGANVPRITSKGVLIEEGRANLQTQSEFASGWSTTNSTITPNAGPAPNGAATAASLVETGATGQHVAAGASISKTSASLTYTGSVYVSPKGRTFAEVQLTSASGGAFVYVNLLTGAVTNGPGTYGSNWSAATATVTPAAGGMMRIALTATNVTDTSLTMKVLVCNTGTSDNYTGDGTSGLYIWGGQVEQASFATSYIPTTSASVTRPADVFYYSGLSANASAITLAAQGLPIAQSFSGRLVFADDGAGTSVLTLAANGGNRAGEVSATGISLQQIPNAPATAAGSQLGSAVRLLGSSGFAASNGVAGGSLAGTYSGVGNFNRMYIGDVSGGNRQFNSYIQRLAIYPFAASDAQLQSISSGNF